jgi:allophanate hydrolase subunit 1
MKNKNRKDIDSIRSLLIHIRQSEYDKRQLETILNKLTKKAQRTIENVCKENYIEL